MAAPARQSAGEKDEVRKTHKSYLEAVAGNLNSASSTGTFASAFSRMIFCLSADPLGPVSIEKGKKYAGDFFVIAEIGFDFDLRALLGPLGQDANLEEVIGIEIDVAHVAVLADDLELVRQRAVDIFGAEILHRAPFRFPIDERSIDLGVFDERLRLVRGHFFGILAALKRRYLPAFSAVVGLHQRHALKSQFRRGPARPLFRQHVGKLELALVHEHLALEPHRLHGAQRIRATFGFDVFGHQGVDGEVPSSSWAFSAGASSDAATRRSAKRSSIGSIPKNGRQLICRRTRHHGRCEAARAIDVVTSAKA